MSFVGKHRELGAAIRVGFASW